MRRVIALCLAGAISFSGVVARADLDLDRAGQDARGYAASGHAGFCEHPSPLTEDSSRLCPLAGDGCEGFSRACAKEARTSPTRDAETPEDSQRKVPEAVAALGRVLVWGLVVAIVLVAIVLVVGALRRAREDRKLSDHVPAEQKPVAKPGPEPEPLPVVTDAELLLRRAAELERAGDHERALYTYLEASLRALDARGAIRIAKDRTHGEYVRGCKEAPAKGPLGEIVREVDRVKFGGALASSETSGKVAGRALGLVRAAMMAIACALLSGCGGDAMEKRLATDPAGTDVLVDLLSRQGVEVGPLRTALARLPIPAEDEENVPAVMVDLARTKVDEATFSHLMKWVSAGGVLVLVERPGIWPKELVAGVGYSSTKEVTATVIDSAAAAAPRRYAPATKTYRGTLAESAAISMKCSEDDPQPPTANTLAWSGDAPFSSFCFTGDGMVIGVASHDLFTNVGMIKPGNAEVAFAILSRVADRKLLIASPMDGIEPPSSPITSIDRAGLGLGMWHALAAAALLFWAIGARLSRATPRPPPSRRAYAEHVEATGLVYARARAASHALAAFAKFVDERLRGLMPRGTSDPASFLAHRSGVPADECARVYGRAMRAAGAGKGAAPVGDELDTLKRLTSLYSSASRRR